MRNIFIIFKKELLDTSRDRRTLFFMVVMPFLAIFLILNLAMKLGTSQAQKAQDKVLKIGFISNDNGASIGTDIMANEKFRVNQKIIEAEIEPLIKNNSLDFAIVIEKEFDKKIKENQTGEILLYFKTSAENDMAKKRVTKILNKYSNQFLEERLQSMQLQKSFVKTINIVEKDMATMKQKLGEYVGGYLPYFIIIFCFMGAMYPAIDLAAGEKERGTIETLLVSPASRSQIVIGKFLVIVLAGVFTAVISMLWLFLVIKQSSDIPEKFLSGLLKILELKTLLFAFSLIIPLCVFFAALLLSASIFAKSYKEAQSIMAPLNFLVIIPVFIGLFPGIKLNFTTAMIPVLNVSLAIKEIIVGTIKPIILIEVYVALIAVAGIGLFFCSQWFKREAVIFRGT